MKASSLFFGIGLLVSAINSSEAGTPNCLESGTTFSDGTAFLIVDITTSSTIAETASGQVRFKSGLSLSSPGLGSPCNGWIFPTPDSSCFKDESVAYFKTAPDFSGSRADLSVPCPFPGVAMASSFDGSTAGEISFTGTAYRYQHFLWNQVFRETPLVYTDRCGISRSLPNDYYLTRQGRDMTGVNTVARNSFVTTWPTEFTGDKIVSVNFTPAGSPAGRVLRAFDTRGTGPIDIQFLPTF